MPDGPPMGYPPIVMTIEYQNEAPRQIGLLGEGGYVTYDFRTDRVSFDSQRSWRARTDAAPGTAEQATLQRLLATWEENLLRRQRGTPRQVVVD